MSSPVQPCLYAGSFYIVPQISFYIKRFRQDSSKPSEWSRLQDKIIRKHKMMSTQDPAILNYAADYRINLIEPAAMRAEGLARLHSSLRAVLGFIKYSNDGNALDAFLASESSLRSLDVEAARVIKICAKTEIEFDENTEVIDACKAEQQMKEKANLPPRSQKIYKFLFYSHLHFDWLSCMV